MFEHFLEGAQKEACKANYRESFEKVKRDVVTDKEVGGFFAAQRSLFYQLAQEQPDRIIQETLLQKAWIADRFAKIAETPSDERNNAQAIMLYDSTWALFDQIRSEARVLQPENDPNLAGKGMFGYRMNLERDLEQRGFTDDVMMYRPNDQNKT